MLTETGWLTGALFGATVICFALFSTSMYRGTADLQIYDTYLVFSVEKPLAAVFLLLAFGIYLVRTRRQRFSTALPNGILLAVGLLLLVSINLLNNYLLTEAMPTGYVVYPPLSAVPTSLTGGDAVMKLLSTTTRSLIGLQLLILAALLYAAFQWGKWGGRQSNR